MRPLDPARFAVLWDPEIGRRRKRLPCATGASGRLVHRLVGQTERPPMHPGEPWSPGEPRAGAAATISPKAATASSGSMGTGAMNQRRIGHAPPGMSTTSNGPSRRPISAKSGCRPVSPTKYTACGRRSVTPSHTTACDSDRAGRDRKNAVPAHSSRASAAPRRRSTSPLATNPARSHSRCRAHAATARHRAGKTMSPSESVGPAARPSADRGGRNGYGKSARHRSAGARQMLHLA